MGRRLLWILLIGLALSVVVLIARHDAGTIGIPTLNMSTDDFGALAYNLALIVFLGGTVLVLFRERFSQALEAALFWTAVGLVLALGYTYRMELRDVGDRVLAEFVPGRAASRGVRTVEIVRGRSGDFQIATRVNGARASMVLDTGASAVVLTQEAAKAAGLPLEVLAYNVTVDTANGRTRAAAVTLDRLAVGNIVERSVPALIAQPGQLRTNLLGMSFLNRLESWEVRGDKLLMRGYR
jgi:aspartyl protease family protein